MEIGVIGLGAVGRGVVAQLLSKTVHNLLAYDPDGRQCEGVNACNTAAEIFSRCDIVVLALDRESDLVTLCNGVVAFLRADQTIIDLTEISPALAHATANSARRQGAYYLDCGVFGRGPGLRPPFLFFVGGSGDAFGRVQTLLLCIAPGCRYVGPAGRGQTCRILCRSLAAETAWQTKRTLRLAEVLGVSPADFAGFEEISHPLAALQGGAPMFSQEELEADRLLAREMAKRAGLSDDK